MKEAYKMQAKELALEYLAKGHDPESLVHLIEYPSDYYLNGVELQHLSYPLPPNSNLAGHTATYYTLGELAE